MKKLLVFAIFILAGLAIGIVFAEESYQLTERNGENLQKNIAESVDNPSGVEDLHWDHMPITYKFSNERACGIQEAKRIRRGFEKIEAETSGTVDFEEGNNSDITINCHKGFNIEYINSDGTVLQADTTYFNDGNEIKRATIDYYDTKDGKISSNCGAYPDTEVHETLHAFGFDHVDNRYHIMNSVGTYCPTKINEDVIEKLKEIYPDSHKV